MYRAAFSFSQNEVRENSERHRSITATSWAKVLSTGKTNAGESKEGTNVIFSVADCEGSRLKRTTKVVGKTATFAELTSLSWRLKFSPLRRSGLQRKLGSCFVATKVAISNNGRT